MKSAPRLSTLCWVLALSACTTPPPAVTRNPVADEPVAIAPYLESPAVAEPPPELAEALPVTALDRPPRAIRKPHPRYPAKMLRAGVEGRALVEFIVDATGTVRWARAVQATHPAFAEEAVVALRRWQFEPGLKDGRAVNCRLRAPVVFKMEEPSAIDGRAQ